MSEPATKHLLRVGARDIPIPSHLSAEAQAQLALSNIALPALPPPEDIAAWRDLISRMDALVHPFLDMSARQIEAEIREETIDGVRIYVATPAGETDADEFVYLDIHGGSLVWGGGASCRATGVIAAGQVGTTVWSVDYRLPPDTPYPAALDDCVAAYRALLRVKSSGKIIIGGASAGGNLAAATILRARDEGLPLPAAAVLLTPEVDLTESGDTFHTLLGVDTALTGTLMPASLLYAAGHDLRHPYLSPLFGDFTKGFPPTFLQSGTRDLFLSNTVRMHRALRAADIPAELHVFEAATHAMFAKGPESADRRREIRRFVDQYWKRKSV